MSKEGDLVGCSKFSPLKWERLRYHLKVHTKICHALIGRIRVHPRYHYFDLYAGPGLYSANESASLAGMVGSPLIALNEINRVGLLGSCYFVEPNHPESLRRSIEHSGFAADSWEVIPERCARATDIIVSRFAREKRKVMGLVFADPNGYPCYESIRRLRSVPAFSKLDFLINVNAAIHKRCFKSPVHPETRRVSEHLRSINKKDIYLWAPHPSQKHQFVFAYLTDGPFPEFPRMGFHKIGNPAGQEISRRMDYTPEERKVMFPPSDIFSFFNVEKGWEGS